MTKKFNKGSRNQNAPQVGNEFSTEFVSGDSSKGNKHNKSQQSKTNPH